ncbi:acyl-CoA dehydrogenase family protein [Martelella soudanensis]|uniref:acyl-CoA dehydrogenase family protein n=1 Tax=unclassified Martelella TaxID=2629616 RepID=UPI0015DF1379|nr:MULTISPECIES: acyl-CoA dehydrogenase family protein [unclassified Martelella]
MDKPLKRDVLSTEESLVEWAHDFAPELHAAQKEINAAARTPERIAAVMEDAGIWKMLVPQAYGGMGARLSTWMRVVTELGRGDAGVAWGVTLNSSCAWMLSANYPRQVIEEVFADPKARLAGVFSDRAVKAHRVEGGLHIDKGRWFFNSGVYQADWNLLGVPILDDAGNWIAPGVALVPMKDVQLLNDWDPSGLRGSGSTNVAMEDVFIPQERIINMGACVQGLQPVTTDEHTVYKVAFGPVMVLILAFPVLGAGMHMLESFLETVAKRDIKLTSYTKQHEAPVTHLQIGEVSAKINAARLILEDACHKLENYAERNEPMPKIERAAITRDSAYANSLVWEAVDLMASAAGGSWAWNGNEMNRVWQDVKVGTMHPFINLASNYEAYGNSAVGIEPGIMPFI